MDYIRCAARVGAYHNQRLCSKLLDDYQECVTKHKSVSSTAQVVWNFCLIGMGQFFVLRNPVFTVASLVCVVAADAVLRHAGRAEEAGQAVPAAPSTRWGLACRRPMHAIK